MLLDKSSNIDNTGNPEKVFVAGLEEISGSFSIHFMSQYKTLVCS
ncbi:hypothetical protein VCHE25_0613 [Vibrio cholerae HE-25]|nr:hypothetical protein VCHE25_0613 [Vibrio cholerae HE-25]